MKKYKSKKSIVLPIVVATSLGMSSLTLADNETNPTNPGNKNINAVNPVNPYNSTGIINAIKDVGNKIVALSFAGMTAFDQAMYQFDKNMANALIANASAKTIHQTTATNTAIKTNNYIKNTMKNVPDSFLSTAEGAINANEIEHNIKTQNAMMNNLTLGVPASDTIYINNPTTIAAGYGSLSPAISDYYNTNTSYTIGPPPLNDDHYFSIASVLEPSAYTTKADQDAVDAYMTYLTQSYKNPAEALKLPDLKSYINSLKPSRQSQTLYRFLSSSQYQSYQLAMRSYIANKSVAINNFEHLIAERTPSKTKVEGIYDSEGQAITHPSTLQVENYQAHHRIDNPAWIQSLQTMSSTSLQREIALELAQVIKQNQQAHLDRERMLTALSALQLQTSEGSRMALNTLAQQVNQEIDNVTGSSKSGNQNGNAEYNPQQQAKKDSKKAEQETKNK